MLLTILIDIIFNRLYELCCFVFRVYIIYVCMFQGSPCILKGLMDFVVRYPVIVILIQRIIWYFLYLFFYRKIMSFELIQKTIPIDNRKRMNGCKYSCRMIVFLDKEHGNELCNELHK